MSEPTNVFLGAGNTAPGFNNAAYFGNSGTEGVTFGAGVAGTTVDQNVEGATFSGSSADYLFQQQGNQLRVFSGATLITTIVIQDDANGTQLTFSNGTTSAKLNAGVLQLGGVAVPTGTPGGVLPGDVSDPGDPGVPGQTFNLIVGPDDITGTAGDDLFRARVVQNQLGAQSNTLGSGDLIDGAAGNNDRLFANVQDASPLNAGPTGSIAPETVDVEIAHFNADANYSIFDDEFEGDFDEGFFGVEINARDMLGLNEVGSVESDSTLIIYDMTTLRDDGVYTNRRETESITVTMDHTGNNSPIQPEADLVVLFDQDYLLAAPPGQADSSLTLQLLDIDSEINSDQPLLTQPFDVLRFTITTNGVTTSYDVSYTSMNSLTGIAAYQALAASINDGLDALGLTDLTAVVNGEFSVIDPDGDPGGPANGFNIIITNAGPGTLDAVGFLSSGVVPPNTDYQKEVFPTPPDEIAEFITVDIILDKVGRNTFAGDGNGGGDLIVGGMATDLQNVLGNGSQGIQQFDVTVRGDSSEPSSLASLQSTNNSLQRVFVESAVGTNPENAADLYIGNKNSVEGINGAIGNSSILGFINNPFDLTTVMNNALKDVILFDSTGNNDQDVGAFVGDVHLHAYFSVENLEKYLNVTDGQPNPGDDDVDAVYTTGVGDDLVNVNIDKTNFVSIGSATRDDFSFTTLTNDGNDHVQIQIGNGLNFNPDDEAEEGGDDEQDNVDGLYNVLNWYQSHVLADNLNIGTGSGDDFVELYGATAARVDLGSGDDWIYTDNSGIPEFFDPEFQDNDLIQSLYHATWVFNSENTGILDLRSYQGFSVANVANLTLTVTYQGIEVTVDVGNTRNAINGATVTDLTINQAIKAAINNAVNTAFPADPQPFNATNPLSKMLVAEDGPGRTLVVRSLVDGQNVATDLAISLGVSGPLAGGQLAPGSTATLLGSLTAGQLATLGFTVSGAGTSAVGTAAGPVAPDADARWDSQFATVTNLFGPTMNGNDSFNVNNNIVEGGTGNDVIVLSSNGGSVETIDIDGPFGNDTIMNFTASIGTAAIPEVQTFEVTGVGDGVGEVSASAMGVSITPFTPLDGATAEEIATQLGAALTTALGAQATVVVDGTTVTVTDSDGTIGNDEDDATISVAGGNEVQTITFSYDVGGSTVGEEVFVVFGGVTATYTVQAGDDADDVAAGLAADPDFNGTGEPTAVATAGGVLTLTNNVPGNIPPATVGSTSPTGNSNLDFSTVETTQGEDLTFAIAVNSDDGQLPATGYDIFDVTDANVLAGTVQGFANNTIDGAEQATLDTMDLTMRNVFIINQVNPGEVTGDTPGTTEAQRIRLALLDQDTGAAAGPNSLVITTDETDPNLARWYKVENPAGTGNLNVTLIGTTELGQYGTFTDAPPPGPGDLDFKNSIGRWEEMSIINFQPLDRNGLVDTFEAYNFII